VEVLRSDDVTDSSELLRVVIIDDDQWVSRGRAAVVEETHSMALAGRLHPREVVDGTNTVDWNSVDVVVVDAHDATAGFDRFVGVQVVERIRQVCGRDRPRVVVITGHVYNELLRLRMAEAGADLFFAHAEITTPDALRAAILTDPVSIDAATGSSVNDALRWAHQHLGEEALADESQKALPVSRRGIITARRRLHGVISPMSDEPPTWRRVVDFLDQARGKERRER
jgi:DNA-binding NarL/FixJ family response regulator